MDHPKKKTNWLQMTSTILVPFLVLEVVLLIMQNRDLRTQLTAMTSQANIKSLLPGDRVAPIRIQHLNGDAGELTYTDTGRQYLLFIFSTTCPHCEKTLPFWKSIAKEPRTELISYCGISVHTLDETRRFVEEKKIDFPVVVTVDTSFRRIYGVSGIPVTMLLKESGNDGIVERTWIGELDTTRFMEVKKFLGDSLSLINSQIQ